MYEQKFFKWQRFQYFDIFLINLINDDAFVLTAMAEVCSIIHVICLFMKMHLLVLLQGNCLELVHCAFLCKLSGCARNITEYCQHLKRPIKLAVLADTDISVKPKYQSISSCNTTDYGKMTVLPFQVFL